MIPNARSSRALPSGMVGTALDDAQPVQLGHGGEARDGLGEEAELAPVVDPELDRHPTPFAGQNLIQRQGNVLPRDRPTGTADHGRRPREAARAVHPRDQEPLDLGFPGQRCAEGGITQGGMVRASASAIVRSTW